MEPLVSVALATYNGAQYLRDQLDSIYNQTYKNIEVIVCDDCSVDDTVNILKEYKKRYGLKFCVNEQRLGFVKNFEKAIGLCKGDYIALCDQDDIWMPEKIETLIKNINGHPIICSDLILVEKNNNVVDTSLYRHVDLRFYSQDQFKYLVNSNFVVGCTTLFQSYLKNYILPFPENIPFHDWWIALVASTMGNIIFYAEPLVRYRYHGNNNSKTGKRNIVNSIFEKIKEVKEKMHNNFYEEKKRWLANIYKSNIFSIEHKKYINTILHIYVDMTEKFFPVKASILALKHRKYMFPRRGPVKRIVFTLGIVFAGLFRLLDIYSNHMGKNSKFIMDKQRN